MSQTNLRRGTGVRRTACSLIAAVSVGACSSSSSTVESVGSVGSVPVETSTTPPATEPGDSSTVPAADGALTSLLSAMPAPAQWGVEALEPVAFVLADVDATEAAAGLSRPEESTATDESIANWFTDLSGRGLPGDSPSVAMPALPAGLNSVALHAVSAAGAFGWSLLDVHAYISDLFGTLTVFLLPTEPAWPSGSGEVSSDGVWSLGDREAAYFDWVPEHPDSAAVRFTWREGRLACSGSTAPARASLATGRPTLADSPAFVDVTRVVDAIGAYGAVVLTPGEYSLSDFVRHNPRASDSDVQEWAEQLVPNTVDALAIGYSVDDGARVTTFVYHHPDPEAAAADAPLLETLFREGRSIRGDRLLSDMFSVQSVEVAGALVTVTVVGDVDPVRLVQDHENITVTR